MIRNNKLKLDNGFSKEDLNQLEKAKLVPPSEINRENCYNYLENAIHVLKRCRSAKGAGVKYGNGDYVAALDRVMNVIRTYINLLKFKSGIIRGGSLKKFSKLRPDGRYGLLEIHMPKLMNDNHITATRNGEIVYDKDCDDDAVELLTKRYNKSKNYSDLSKEIFEELTKLGQVPRTRNTVKFDKICICDDYSSNYYNGVPDDESDDESHEDNSSSNDNWNYGEGDDGLDAKKLLTRLQNLSELINDGIDDMGEEFTTICDALFRKKVIDNEQRNKLLEKYVDKKEESEEEPDDGEFDELDDDIETYAIRLKKLLDNHRRYPHLNYKQEYRDICDILYEKGVFDAKQRRKVLEMY